MFESAICSVEVCHPASPSGVWSLCLDTSVTCPLALGGVATFATRRLLKEVGLGAAAAAGCVRLVGTLSKKQWCSLHHLSAVAKTNKGPWV